MTQTVKFTAETTSRAFNLAVIDQRDAAEETFSRTVAGRGAL
jgi:hypothetical protein